MIQDAYVSVPVTNDIMTGVRPDGGPCPDTEKMVASAVAYAAADVVDWQVESMGIEVHPIQGPLPEGRVVFIPEGDVDWWEGTMGSIG